MERSIQLAGTQRPAATFGSASFSGGTATVNATLFRAGNTTLTAAEGAASGTSGTFAVNSAGVALSFSGCGTVARNANVAITLDVPVDNSVESVHAGDGDVPQPFGADRELELVIAHRC